MIPTTSRRAAAFLAASLATGGALACCGPASASNWDTYLNARFDYGICYPADLLTAQPEADNGDGRAFTGAHGEKLEVWGSYNANDDTLKTEIDGLAQSLGGPSAQVSYRHVSGASASISGRGKGAVFYARVLAKDDKFLAFALTYPEGEASTFNAVTERLVKCFRPTPAH